MATQLDVSSVGIRGGEFIAGELERAVDVEPVTKAAVEEIIAYGKDRGSWLIFCAGVNHALHVRDAVRAAGFTAETITGETNSAERDSIIREFKAGRVRCLTNMSVLTTGFDAPGVDLIGMLRPTQSAGLYVQMIGRRTRLAEGKDNCLLLDFAGNTRRHGPGDRVKVSAPGRRRGRCADQGLPAMLYHLLRGVRTCPSCGFEFPEPEKKIAPKAATDAVLSTQIEAVWVNVDEVTYHYHKKEGKPPSMRVKYLCGYTVHREWIFFEHTGFARQKACAWWAKRSTLTVPGKVSDALALAPDLRRPSRIAVQPEGKFTEIANYDFARRMTFFQKAIGRGSTHIQEPANDPQPCPS